MPDQENTYRIWVDWDRQTVSLTPAAGYEMICFFSREAYQENLQILRRSGFRFE